MNITAKELLEGLRDGSIMLRVRENPLPINYYPGPSNETVECRGFFEFHLTENFVLRIPFAVYVLFDDCDGSPKYREMTGDVEQYRLLVSPSDDGNDVCFYKSREDLLDGISGQSLPAGCSGEELTSICTDLQAILRAEMPSLEPSSEAGALRWMQNKNRRFCQVVYDRFCTLTASSLLQGLRDGSIVIKSDPATIPMEHGEWKLSDVEDHSCRLNVERDGEVLFYISISCLNFWQVGDRPDDAGSIFQSYRGWRGEDSLRVTSSEKPGMVVFYCDEDGLPEDEMYPLFLLPAGCRPEELNDLCAELQRWFEEALPDFGGPCEAEELAWLHHYGAYHYIGFDEDGRFRTDLWLSILDDNGERKDRPCPDSLFVKVVSDRSRGRWIFGVKGIDRLFLCPKEAGEAAKAILIEKLQNAAERVASLDFVAPKELGY